MAFDGLMMSAVKDELKKILVGSRIEKIYQPLAHETVLIVHREKSRHRLLVSAHARDARIHITAGSRENPLTPPQFCMVLRKHLTGGRISGFDQAGLERILVIRIEAVNELGIPSEKALICEIMGKHSNIILVEPATNLILDGINRYSYATSRHREVLPGRRYIPPPDHGKIDPLTLTENIFRDAVWDPNIEIHMEKVLLKKFSGLSPQTCREILVRAGIHPQTSNQSLGDIELNSLWSSFNTIIENTLSGIYEPSLYYKGSSPKAFSAIRLTHLPDVRCKTGTVSQVLDEFFTARALREKFQDYVKHLLKITGNEIKKCQKKIAIYRETLKEAANAEQFKVFGELVTANIYQIPQQAEIVEVVNYYDPEGQTVSIPLDPQLSSAQNAQAYFKKYAKTRNSLLFAQNRLAVTQTELDYLESVNIALEQSERFSDLEEIKSELIKEGYIAEEKVAAAGRKPAGGHEPAVMSFAVDGFELLAGRNNRQNDYLTMKLARPDDLWLHTKDIPGAHIIIRNPEGREIPDPVVQKAAGIAAYFSKGRNSSKVPVDYTLKKNVRKPKGAKPGMVIYDNHRTILAEPWEFS